MKKHSLFFAFLLALMFWVFYKTLTSTIDYNPEEPGVATQELLVRIFPQGWSFFTKDPFEPVLDVYHIKNTPDQSAVQKMLFPNGDYYLGASRYSRALLYQMKSVIPQITPDKWVKGSGAFSDSLQTAFGRKTNILSNEKYDLLTPGDYVLIYTERVPWVSVNNPLTNKKVYRMAYISIY